MRDGNGFSSPSYSEWLLRWPYGAANFSRHRATASYKKSVTIYLTELWSRLRSAVTGRLRLLVRCCLALVRFSRFFPVFSALVDLRLWHAYNLFRKPLEALKGFWVWRFGFL